MRKDEAVGNNKKMQVCLPKHNYKSDNNLLTVEPRAVDPHCFDANPDPAQNLDADPDPDPGGGGVRSAKNVHPPWQNARYAPWYRYLFVYQSGSGSIRIPSFDDQKLKKLCNWKKIFFFSSKTTIYLPRPPERTSKLQKSLQPSKENINFFLLLWVIFALMDPNLDPDSEYGSVFRIRIRI